LKLAQSIKPDLIPAPQLFNEGSKTQTQTSKIPSTDESERLKSIFLDTITHDFKTPLTSIKVSVTSLLGDLETDLEQRKELLTIIDEECDRINRLVSEASEMVRLESSEVKLDLASHAVEELISAALADCRGVNSNREICLDVNHLDSRLLIDLSLAKRVLVHLITNAQLYSSPDKPITITTKQRDKFHDISVADQGPGIEEEEIEHIFEKFYRGKNVRYRVPGTGMGLPIAKMIVEAHGGTIRVVNCAGRGSVFTFSLPAKRDGHTKHLQRNMRRELKRTPGRDSKTMVAIRDEIKRASSASRQWLEAYSPKSANSPK
jgi:two-component system, OmpR family, sensor histidine kinase KdpD